MVRVDHYIFLVEKRKGTKIVIPMEENRLQVVKE